MKTVKRQILFFGLIFLILFLYSCAPNSVMYESNPAGFWAGLWHGFIAWITFIISLFTDTIRMYEVNNSGGLYDLGFLFGLSIFMGSSGWYGGKKKKRRR